MKHFEEGSPFEHIQNARMKTKAKLKENHAVETKSYLDAFIRVMSETSMFFGILEIYDHFSPTNLVIRLGFVLSFIFFRSVYCALDGWSRLERLHRVITEERYEIEHHENQEREELKEIYRGKGFEGKLLDDVVSTLMADRNRLLSIMLEEELGLKIEVYEHPLEQAFGALIGGLIVLIPMIFSLYFLPLIYSFSILCLFVLIGAFLKAWIEKISRLKTCVWHLANFGMVTSLLYFGLKSVLG